jgi:UPF0755 protein
MRTFAIILATLFIIALSYEVYLLIIPRPIQEVVVEIQTGEPAARIGDKLVQHGVIRSKWPFVIYVRLRNIDQELSWGKYLFSGRMSTAAVVKKLLEGDVMTHRVVIPEGLTVRETARRLDEQGFGDYNTFVDLVKDIEFATQITGFPIETLEGFLYPETYYFAEGVSEEFILRRMVNEFFHKTSELQLPNNFDFSFYEMIILASIIEKEARYIDEMPLISSVFINRLNIGKRLQADPTVAYALAREGIERRTIYYIDLQIDSPYNTYQRIGLPPAPICSPSLPAMQAVLQPAESEFLYFFADQQGRHIFSKTYREHLNKQRALRNR